MDIELIINIAWWIILIGGSLAIIDSIIFLIAYKTYNDKLVNICFKSLFVILIGTPIIFISILWECSKIMGY